MIPVGCQHARKTSINLNRGMFLTNRRWDPRVFAWGKKGGTHALVVVVSLLLLFLVQPFTLHHDIFETCVVRMAQSTVVFCSRIIQSYNYWNLKYHHQKCRQFAALNFPKKIDAVDERICESKPSYLLE